MRLRAPPSSFHTGFLSAFPLMSHSAMSIAAKASVNIPPGPAPPAASRNFLMIASRRSGSSPTHNSHSWSIALFSVRVSAPP